MGSLRSYSMMHGTRHAADARAPAGWSATKFASAFDLTLSAFLDELSERISALQTAGEVNVAA